MAASGGRFLVSKALVTLRLALDRTGRVLRDKFPQAARTVQGRTQPLQARNPAHRHPISHLATIRRSNSQSRWYSNQQAAKSSLRQFSSGRSTSKYGRSALLSSKTIQAVGRLTGRAPFATTLRPNLTGGTLHRTAGGYGTGCGRIGGARYFSHAPAAPAQVLHDVSQAVRVFWLGGQKVQFDGVNARNEKQFKAVSALQDEVGRKIASVPEVAVGSHLDFQLSPTITAIGALSMPTAAFPGEYQSLGNAAVLSSLSADFARALKDLAVVMDDLQKLSSLGDLSISLPNSSTLRVRFPGCDRDHVNRLCEELDIRRGLIYQDEDFDSSNRTAMALLFPFAPDAASMTSTFLPGGRKASTDRRNMLSPQQRSSPKHSTQSMTSDDFEEVGEIEANPWLSSLSGYSSLTGSDQDEAAAYFRHDRAGQMLNSSDYEGVEGIYRFLEQCDRARQ